MKLITMDMVMVTQGLLDRTDIHHVLMVARKVAARMGHPTAVLMGLPTVVPMGIVARMGVPMGTVAPTVVPTVVQAEDRIQPHTSTGGMAEGHPGATDHQGRKSTLESISFSRQLEKETSLKSSWLATCPQDKRWQSRSLIRHNLTREVYKNYSERFA